MSDDWGPDARGKAIFRLADALSTGRGDMLQGLIAIAPDKAALGQLVYWALHTFGPEELRATETYNALAFLGPPYLDPSKGVALDMRAWAEWQQNLQNELDEYADSTVGQYTNATYERLESSRKTFNGWAAQLRAAGVAVGDVAAVELPATTPLSSDGSAPPSKGKMLAVGAGVLVMAAGVFAGLTAYRRRGR